MNNGATEVINKTELMIGSTVNNDAGHYTQKAVVENGQVVAVPVTTLETGSVITCGANGPQGFVGSFVIETGSLDIKNRKTNGEPTADRTAMINAHVLALFSDAMINMLGARYNTLSITGKFAYQGGIYMSIAASADQADLIKVTGKVELTVNSAKIKFYWG